MQLRDTKWLANRLGISLSTVEKLRSEESEAIPAAITIGKTIRYGDTYVEWWLQRRLLITAKNYNHWLNEQTQLANKATDKDVTEERSTEESNNEESNNEESNNEESNNEESQTEANTKITATPRFYKAKASQSSTSANHSNNLQTIRGTQNEQ